MTKMIFLSLSLFLFTGLLAQTSTDITVVIVACKTGTLVIDGNTIGPVEADDATRQSLSFGEHYLQLKTSSGKFNQTIKIDQNTKEIIKIGCEASAPTEGARLIDTQIALTGLLGVHEQNPISLDKDDEIILNSSILNKKGKATLFIKDYTNNREIFRKADFNSIVNERIKIPSRGIYLITIYTDALFGKEAKLSVDRVPSANSSPSFNTGVKTVYDTSSVEVVRTITKVYAAGDVDHPNRATVPIHLPQNTAYWVYWIGVGPEAQSAMQSFNPSVSNTGTPFSGTNPLVWYGMKQTSSLPMLTSPSTINYRFVTAQNAQAFMKAQPYKFYVFKQAENITTDYLLVKNNLPDLLLAIQNQNATAMQDVEFRVVAFVVSSKFVVVE